MKRRAGAIYCRDCGLHVLEPEIVRDDERAFFRDHAHLFEKTKHRLMVWAADPKCRYVTKWQRLALDSFIRQVAQLEKAS